MLSVCFLFLFLSSQSLHYTPREKPLNGSELRGLRPVVQEEIVMTRLGDDWLLVFSGRTRRQTALYSRLWIEKTGEWSQPIQISDEEAGGDSLPHIWVDSRQIAHCVWQSRQDREFVVRYAQLPAGSGEWSQSRRIDGASGAARKPVAIAGDSKGNLFIWSHNRPLDERFFELQLFASADAGLTWEPLEPFQALQGNNVAFFEPRVAVSGDDEVFVTTLRSQGITSVLLTSSKDAGRSWTSPMMVSANSSPRISDPRLLISGDVVQVTWLDQPTKGNTKRLEAALLSRKDGVSKLQRVLVQSVAGVRELTYSIWMEGTTVGLTWLEKFNNSESRVHQRRTLANRRVDLSETLTIAVSSEGSHFGELAAARDPGIVLVTEKKLLSRSKLMACSKVDNESWNCENLHIAPGASDILAPMLVELGQQKGYRVIFHEVLRKRHIMEAVWDTTILTGRLILTSKGGEAGAGENQSHAAIIQVD